MRKTTLALMALLGLSACLEGKVESDDDDGDSGDADADVDTDSDGGCGSGNGFVSGTVSGPDGQGPNPDATVWAWNEAGETVEAELGGDGTYELNLLGDEAYILFAEAWGCYSPDTELFVEACVDYEVDIEITDCDVAEKPNLYLYPHDDLQMDVRVEHGHKQQIVASDPPHGDRGWSGIAHPDGTFTQDGDRAPFLFYEVSIAPWQGRTHQREAGWCIDGGPDAVHDMAKILEMYDFNAGEVDDFVEGWRLDLPPAAAYAVYPQREVAHMAQLVMAPELPVDRLWLLVEEGSGCAPMYEPEVVPMDRRGEHGVEWGVILHGLAL
jgi:hypothetical protein